MPARETGRVEDAARRRLALEPLAIETSFLDDLEEQLRAAAHERAPHQSAPGWQFAPGRRSRRRRGRRWLAGGARLAPVLVAVAVTLGIVVGAFVLLGHRGHASSTPPASPAPSGLGAIVATTPRAQLHREFVLIAAATKKVLASRTCHVATRSQVRFIPTPPGHALLSTPGCCAGRRRRPTGSPHTPSTPWAARESRSTPVPRGAPSPRDRSGSSSPCGRARRPASPQTGASRCRPKPSSALSPRCRRRCAATLAFANALIAYDRRLARHAPIDGICEITVLAHNGRTSDCGTTVSQIQRGILPEAENGTFSGVAPDGVIHAQVPDRHLARRARLGGQDVFRAEPRVTEEGVPPASVLLLLGPTAGLAAAQARRLTVHARVGQDDSRYFSSYVRKISLARRLTVHDGERRPPGGCYRALGDVYQR